ncbi:hypothetical protein OHV63_08865 [Acinetobacter baumannii]|uniref:hypothetical protein n=1 Tax=Acinetobacter baumannii TaxID=470 RepID=UPI0008105704|nr:hypothetical protein [Acinetobacter baumannii]MDC4612136.1 hypothetical protein [Acinetobacter baumannii]MDC5015835.1 hypothetical protein [Acinetobacter baumannii]MDV7568873.1 hypothetical protein [Acinetobacter baumannii]WFF52720.1 hypothetical protein OSV61_12870 [Acinetobacter baumannii]
MDNFIEALEKAIESENWYGALFIMLTLPDICGKIDEPSSYSKPRYVNWFNKYLLQKYILNIEAQDLSRKEVLISGEGFYDLRCAYLHAGSDELNQEKIKQIVEKVKFTIPHPNGGTGHRLRLNNVLQLQVDLLGKDIIEAIKHWMKDIRSDKVKLERLSNLATITTLNF